MDRYYDPDHPIVLGLAGKAATGKTITGQGLAPPARVNPDTEDDDSPYWDHLYFAMPLYQMARARQDIEGKHRWSRTCYEIHSTLLEVFGDSPLYGAPEYDDLVKMVREIATIPCPREGKPRSFLQYVGTEIVRAYDPDAWVKWMARKVDTEHRNYLLDNATLDEDGYGVPPTRPYGVVISDCRFPNEAQYIKDHPNGILVELWARDEVRAARLNERDGITLTDAQQRHASEQTDAIPKEWYTVSLNTSDISPQEQIAVVKKIVHDYMRGTDAEDLEGRWGADEGVTVGADG